jgi:hypothetical protein
MAPSNDLRYIHARFSEDSFPKSTALAFFPRYYITIENSEAPRPQGGASRKGNFIHIVPPDPTYKAGLAGHVPVKMC